MKTKSQENLQSYQEPIIGSSMEGGFYAGRIRIADQLFALIVAPKFDGEHHGFGGLGDYTVLPAAQSYNDGFANTEAMVESGSELGMWARGLRIGGHDDWYLPSQDELEIIYRNLKPTTEENECYARSGINLSAATPTHPYTPESPSQTNASEFKAEGTQALGVFWYWSSTQHAGDPYCIWIQNFAHGTQDYISFCSEYKARAVRRVSI